MLWMSALIGSAWACAGLVHGESLLAESGQAAVIFERAGDGVHVTYEVVYEGDAADFGWIVPVPGDFVALEEAAAERFDQLDQLTAPEVVEIADERAGGGCFRGKSDAGGRNLGDTGLEIVAEGFTGTYHYVAIRAADAEQLATWLSDHGWEAGDSAAAIDAYVGLGDTIVAVEVLPTTANTPEEGRALPPVTITYAGDLMRFPATMAATASAAEQRTTVYVLGEGTATVEGWASAPTGELVGSFEDGSAAVWAEHLRAQGAAGGYALTWSGQGTDSWVTRFDTIAPREVHDKDAVFDVQGGPEEHQTTITLYEEPPASSQALGLLPLAALGLWARRRSA